MHNNYRAGDRSARIGHVRVSKGNRNWAWQSDANLVIFFWERTDDQRPWKEVVQELADGDLLEALQWADHHACGRSWSLAAVVDHPTAGDRGLVWLLGCDLNTDVISDAQRTTERRMHARRGRRILAGDDLVMAGAAVGPWFSNPR